MVMENDEGVGGHSFSGRGRVKVGEEGWMGRGGGHCQRKAKGRL